MCKLSIFNLICNNKKSHLFEKKKIKKIIHFFLFYCVSIFIVICIFHLSMHLRAYLFDAHIFTNKSVGLLPGGWVNGIIVIDDYLTPT